jgi:hypothetical protein
MNEDTPAPPPLSRKTAQEFARETQIRDLYARRLQDFRPHERLIKTETSFADTRVRADMRTVDKDNLLRIWEFEIHASYEGLGQALTYLALARKELDFAQRVCGVLAAFTIQQEILTAIEVLNLGIEPVIVPKHLAQAGGIPLDATPVTLPDIPLHSSGLSHPSLSRGDEGASE